MNEQPLPSICFVCHNAYGSIAEGQTGHIGGAERQVSLIAKWMARRGYSVSVLTWGQGRDDPIEIDGVRIHKMCRADEGIPGLRFFHPRWTSLNRALRRADANIYYQTCEEFVTGQVSIWCKRNRRRFVHAIASESGCNTSLPKISSIRGRVLYRYGLRNADLVIAQTRKQQSMLKEGFGRDSVVVPMPCPDPVGDNYVQRSLADKLPFHILWVGRVCPVKRPEMLLELARECSNLHFDMVGPLSQDDATREIVKSARELPNLTLHGRVDDDKLKSMYRSSDIYCSTSEVEGFPNTFLEAWSYGLPIVSTFDPDNLIAEGNLGITCTNVSELAAGMNRLLAEPETWQQASKAARRYYLQNHCLDAAMALFENAVSRTFSGFAPQRDNGRHKSMSLAQ